jgi:hypothetical protein
MRGRSALLTCFFLVISVSLSLFSQGQNSCGVVAVLSPGGDSVLNGPSLIYFQSASINATSYKIFIGPYSYPLNTPVNVSMSPGLTIVRLVAYNGNCTDTATAYYFYAGQYPAPSDNPRAVYGYPDREQAITGLTAIKDGGYVITGHRNASSTFNEVQQGLIVKTKQTGCVGWTKKLTGNRDADVTLAKEAADGGVFIAADVNYTTHFIARFDPSGNLQWSRSIEAANGTSLQVQGMEALPDGGVVMVCGYPKPAVIRLNPDGAIVWQREYNYFTMSSSTAFNHILFKNNAIYAGGMLSYNDFSVSDMFLTKIDYATGGTIWTKNYTSTSNGFRFRNMVDADSVLLVNVFEATGVSPMFLL